MGVICVMTNAIDRGFLCVILVNTRIQRHQTRCLSRWIPSSEGIVLVNYIGDRIGVHQVSHPDPAVAGEGSRELRL